MVTEIKPGVLVTRVLDFDGKLVVAERICAIEHGGWNNDAQDWYATLVCTGNTRVETDVLVRQAREIIEHSDNAGGGRGRSAVGRDS